MAGDHEREPAEHLPFGDIVSTGEQPADALCESLVVGDARLLGQRAGEPEGAEHARVGEAGDRGDAVPAEGQHHQPIRVRDPGVGIQRGE
jgi:hypothetical protein